MMTETTAREFNEFDWNTFASCERWPNGDAPVMRGIGDYLVVACAGAVGAYTEDDELHLDLQFPTQAAAMAFLNGLPDHFDPLQHGFAQI